MRQVELAKLKEELRSRTVKVSGTNCVERNFDCFALYRARVMVMT